MYDSLSDNGVVISNTISSLQGNKGKFLSAEYTTYKSVFPQVYIFPVTSFHKNTAQNIMLIALKSKTPPDFFNSNKELQSYLSHKINFMNEENKIILTDNYAPVEQYAMGLF